MKPSAASMGTRGGLSLQQRRGPPVAARQVMGAQAGDETISHDRRPAARSSMAFEYPVLDLNDTGLTCGTETLDPIMPESLGDGLARSAIGARTTASRPPR